jgi:hypothetical protein
MEERPMKFHIKVISAAALSAMVSTPMIVVAQVPVMPHPAKAPPTAPLAKPAIIATSLRPSALVPLPPKPIISTAVAPWRPVPGTHRSIIFVGGKPQSGSQAELNPQPIPPGRGGPGDPQR